MVKMTAHYLGGLRCEAIHGPSNGTLLTDAPVDNHGRGEAFSPTDLLAAALGSCMLTVMGIYAERHGIGLTGARALATKEMTTEGIRRIRRIAVRLELPVPADHPQRQALERAALSCPVHQSLHPEIEKPVEFVWNGQSEAV
jgi:putative redox protein